jgi:hypothetical protein
MAATGTPGQSEVQAELVSSAYQAKDFKKAYSYCRDATRSLRDDAQLVSQCVLSACQVRKETTAQKYFGWLPDRETAGVAFMCERLTGIKLKR